MLKRRRETRRLEHAVRELTALNQARTVQANVVVERALAYGKRVRDPRADSCCSRGPAPQLEPATRERDLLLFASQRLADLDAELKAKCAEAKELGIHVTIRDQP